MDITIVITIIVTSLSVLGTMLGFFKWSSSFVKTEVTRVIDAFRHETDRMITEMTSIKQTNEQARKLIKERVILLEKRVDRLQNEQ